jgi:transcription-repair coupling factor (superfamily II helicase)
LTHPAVRDLFASLGRHPALQDVLRRVSSRESLSLTGLTVTAKAAYTVLLWQLTEIPIVVIVDGNRQAESLFASLETFFDLLIGSDREAPQLLPAPDVLPGQRVSPHAEILEQRALGLSRLAAGKATITVMPVAAALLRACPAEYYRQLALTLRAGDEVPLDDLLAHLESIGYERREPVELVGEYSVRGGILDVFPPEAPQPVRIDFFGDQIDSIRRFEVESQRSVLKISEATLLPLSEFQKSRALLAELTDRLGDSGVPSRELPNPGDPFGGWELLSPLIRSHTEAVFDLLTDPIVIWDEPELTKGAADRLWVRLEQTERSAAYEPERIFFGWDELQARALRKTQIQLRELDLSGAEQLHIPTRPTMSFHGNIPVAIAEARNLVDSGYQVAFFARTAGELERMADILNQYGVAYQLALDQSSNTPAYLAERAYMAGSVASIYLVRGNVSRGAIFRDSALAIIGADDLFDASELAPAPAAKSHIATFSADTFDLKPGDFVVHMEHGVGQFLGIREIAQGDAKGDYMLIEYSGGSKLYVPLTRMDLVQRFRGAGEAAPPLDRIGGVTWSRTKSRVKARMRDMAEELLKLYATRKMAEGFPFSPDSNWQREFEDAFEFTPTKDQLAAFADIKRDMENPHPMDRLLCGDVGFGKTEVAMRAAFKALGDGKQVAVLAPTTVLAFQHFETFKRRFQPFPVRIEMFSRFRTPKEIKAAVEELANGKLDIAIGTHRLLSKDVEFRDLGLVIVDEEQRFGVAHKERLKQLKKSIDVVSMSATPIPRTLNMSLLGLRDMSVIETPPKDRLAIQTTVAHFHPDLIRTAIELEIGRGGQVYFLHNRVDSIWARASDIQQWVPQARIGVGHAQLPEAELEKVMLRFMRHEYDVLVSTTIVENGLDIPLANTIIIENAERYGLSELYQLRGRVGRSNRRAYAYLLVPTDSELSEVARKRLAALKEFSELGAGFKIAALDLELRGAGNLLGGEQHGHINAVGYDMFIRLMDETVRELKGEEVPVEVRSSLNLGLDIRIPPEYISEENQRLRAYRQIANTRSAEDRTRVAKELEDRYGPVPDAVHNLLEYSSMKSAAERLGIESIDRRHNVLSVKFHQETRVDPGKLMNIVSQTRNAQFTPAGILILPLDGTVGPGGVLRELAGHLAALG